MRFTSTGFGQFQATNGVDTVTAVFSRGTKDTDGTFHPHWDLTFNGETTPAYVDKQGAVQLATKLLTAPMEKPLTDAESDMLQTRDGTVHGIVAVDLCDLIDNDLDAVLDLLNEKLTERLLCDISYRVVGFSEDGKKLYLRVSGHSDET